MKITKFMRFSNQNENKGKLISKFRSWNNKIIIITRYVWNKNPTSLLQKKVKQGYDIKSTQNWCWTNWKSWEIVLLFIPIGHLAQWSFLRNFQPTCVIHVHPYVPMCTHVWTMNELRFNWYWMKSWLIIN
jgi:hypothetical protein